jgi:phospholipase/carboxylesterase
MRQEVHQSATLEYLALTPDGTRPRPLLIWLHGFGADMYDLAPLAAAVHPTGYAHVLLNAPPGVSGGTVRAWYERGGKERAESVRLALAGLDAAVGEILAKFSVPTGQAMLVGFSQGGALALRYGLPRPEMFKGLAILSGSLRQVDDLRENLPPRRDQALFLAHGTEDEMVPVECSERVVTFLREQGYHPLYREYPMGHEIQPALFVDLLRWITTTLPLEDSESA